MKVAKLTREPEIHGDADINYSMDAIDGIVDEVRMSDIGDKLFIELVEMSQEEFDELPEFDGW